MLPINRDPDPGPEQGRFRRHRRRRACGRDRVRATRLGSPAGAESPDTKAASGSRNQRAHRSARKYFIFFDFAFNSPIGAMASVKAAQHFIDSEAAPEDEVAVMSYSAAKGLKVHEFLTNDLAKARQAVAGISAKEISGRAEEIEREYWDLRGYTTSDTSDPFLRGEVLRTEAGRRQSKSQAQDYLSTLDSLGQGHAAHPREQELPLFSTESRPLSFKAIPPSLKVPGWPGAILSQPTQFSYDMGEPDPSTSMGGTPQGIQRLGLLFLRFGYPGGGQGHLSLRGRQDGRRGERHDDRIQIGAARHRHDQSFRRRQGHRHRHPSGALETDGRKILFQHWLL
ncbi:MAG: hypothetical protein MZV63_58550 [Marinilabiliales bacterium]|nr:hypothetical protein [Marinilabiliales bacterium]